MCQSTICYCYHVKAAWFSWNWGMEIVEALMCTSVLQQVLRLKLCVCVCVCVCLFVCICIQHSLLFGTASVYDTLLFYMLVTSSPIVQSEENSTASATNNSTSSSPASVQGKGTVCPWHIVLCVTNCNPNRESRKEKERDRTSGDDNWYPKKC